MLNSAMAALTHSRWTASLSFPLLSPAGSQTDREVAGRLHEQIQDSPLPSPVRPGHRLTGKWTVGSMSRSRIPPPPLSRPAGSQTDREVDGGLHEQVQDSPPPLSRPAGSQTDREVDGGLHEQVQDSPPPLSRPAGSQTDREVNGGLHEQVQVGAGVLRCGGDVWEEELASRGLERGQHGVGQQGRPLHQLDVDHLPVQDVVQFGQLEYMAEQLASRPPEHRSQVVDHRVHVTGHMSASHRTAAHRSQDSKSQDI